MKRRTNIVLTSCLASLLILLLDSVSAQAQETRTFKGKLYVQSGQKWFHLVGKSQYEVDISSITVKAKEGTSSDVIERFHRSQGARIIRTNILGYVDLEVAPPGDVFRIAHTYLDTGLFESVDLNTFGEFHNTPNDPLYNSQWNLNQSNDIDIDMPEAWNIVTGSSTVVIGILDSGTDWTHQDLGYGTGSNNYSNVWLNVGEDAWSNPNDPTTGDHIDNDGNGFVDDWKGWDFYGYGDLDLIGDNDCRSTENHGTLVAGIAAAKTNNGIGVSGVAGGWGAQGSRLHDHPGGTDSSQGDNNRRCDTLRSEQRRAYHPDELRR